MPPYQRPIYVGSSYMDGGMMPPFIIPFSETTDQTFFTAPTQPATQPQDSDTQTEEISESQNPYDHLWGRLVCCNPANGHYDLNREKIKYTVGRTPNNDIIALAPKISGRHCEISLTREVDGTESVNVHDLSSNGTYIDGRKIGRGRYGRLQHGNELSLGVPGQSVGTDDDYRFIFRMSSAPILIGDGFHAQYEFGDTLGAGTFATVKKAHSKVNGSTFAVKIIAKHRFVNNPKTKEMFERELAILQNLRHHNITQLVEYFEDESTIYIVMELVGGGELLDYIINNGPVAEDQARIWTKQMVDAVAYTHNKQITHRDLKPENILLTGSEPRNVKIADFGLAKAVDHETFLTTMCGTPSYLAPEVVLRGPHDGYDFKVDCWSLGVIIYSMMTNMACFVEDETQPLQQRMMQRRVEWSNLRRAGVSQLCMDFVSRLIVNDPQQRMSIVEAQNHPWIRDIQNHPPPEWVGSQTFSQGSDFDNNGSSRGYTEPPPDGWHSQTSMSLGNNSSNGSGGTTGSSGQGQWTGNYQYQSRNLSGFSSASSIAMQPSFGGQSAYTPMDTPSPKDLDQCSQDMKNLRIRHSGDSGEIMDSASPASTKYPNDQMNEDSWQVIPSKADGLVAVDVVRPVKAIPRQTRGAQNITVDPPSAPRKNRSTTPKPSALRPPPSAVKRKAQRIDPDESSELSSVPPSDDELAVAATTNARSTRKAAAKPPLGISAKPSISSTRVSARLRDRTTGSPNSPISMNTNVKSARSVRKKPATNRFKAPGSSSEEEGDEYHQKRSPTSTKSKPITASSSSATSKRTTRQGKAPRLS